MANVFDQFDRPEQRAIDEPRDKPEQQAGNLFDQFDDQEVSREEPIQDPEPAQTEDQGAIAQDVDDALSKIPGAMGLAEFAAGANRSILGALDFLGPDNINAILELSGSEKRIPTLTGELGAEKGQFVEGLPGEILGGAGEVAGMAAGFGQALRTGAAQLSPLAQASESALRGILRQTGKVGPVADVALGALSGAGAAVGKEVGGVPGELIGGVVAPLAGGAIPALVSTARRAAATEIPAAAKELIKSGEEAGLKILTSDIIPPETFAGKSLQQLGEKLGPMLGTGGERATQQKARQEVVENVAQEFGIALDSPLEASIVKSLEKGIAERLNKAATIRNEAVDALDTFGDVPTRKIIDAIDKQLSRQRGLRGEADSAIVSKLNSLKDSLSTKQVIDPITQTRVPKDRTDFSFIKNLRSNLIDDVNAAYKGEALPTKAAAPLQAVKKSFDNTLLSFAKDNDRQAAAKWLRSNKLFADPLRKAKETELKRLLTKGTETPEVVGSILKGGKPSELNRLERFIGPEGRKAAKASIIRDALTESGFFSGNVNPDRFVTAMQKPARQKAINVFFKGADKKQIEGLTRLLDATRRAQQAAVATATGQALVPVALTGAATQAPLTTFLTAGTLASAAKGYESKFVRNALLKLANTPKGSKEEIDILNRLIPSMLGAIDQENTPETQ